VTLALVKYPARPLLTRCAAWDFGLERDPVSGLTLGEIVAQMFDVMYASGGVGLSANQVGLSWRLFVADVDAGTPRQGEHPMVVINPELSQLEGEQFGREGCLSLDARVHFPVKRAMSLHFTGFGIDGKPFEGDVSGWSARLLQHEVGHLDGVCCLDLTDRFSRQVAVKKLRNIKGAGVPSGRAAR
jgi:peptide deformylase